MEPTEKSKLIRIILNCALEQVLLSDCKQQTFSMNVTLSPFDDTWVQKATFISSVFRQLTATLKFEVLAL